MTILALVPTQLELNLMIVALSDAGHRAIPETMGVLPVMKFPDVAAVAAQGGLGKAQFAAQTQHLIAQGEWEAVICAGAAGALADSVSVGDVVIATETVEHDIRNRFGPPRMPRFKAAPCLLARCRAFSQSERAFTLHFDAIASGDEDVVDEARRDEVRERTGAIAVAWEGAGGARACRLSGMPYLEVRGISDGANNTAAGDFAENLPLAMRNVASLLIALGNDEHRSESGDD